MLVLERLLKIMIKNENLFFAKRDICNQRSFFCIKHEFPQSSSSLYSAQADTENGDEEHFILVCLYSIQPFHSALPQVKIHGQDWIMFVDWLSYWAICHVDICSKAHDSR